MRVVAKAWVKGKTKMFRIIMKVMVIILYGLVGNIRYFDVILFMMTIYFFYRLKDYSSCKVNSQVESKYCLLFLSQLIKINRDLSLGL